jgi:hypothetical protein
MLPEVPEIATKTQKGTKKVEMLVGCHALAAAHLRKEKTDELLLNAIPMNCRGLRASNLFAE